MGPSFGWWGNKEAHRGTPVVVKMEKPNWSIADISSPNDDDDDYGSGGGGEGASAAAAEATTTRKGWRGKNAKQITWVLLLKAHHAARCLTGLASAALGLASAVRRRVSSGRTDSDAGSAARTDSDAGSAATEESPVLCSRFYSFIRGFLVLSLLLVVEVAAYFEG